MNFEKYIIVNGLEEKKLNDDVQELANLYADTGFTKEVRIFKSKIASNVFVINFSRDTDFERFKYFVNFLFYPFDYESNHEVYGYWNLTQDDDINKELYGKRIQLYISANDEDGDNVYGIPQNWDETIKLCFAIGRAYVPIGRKEFDFFEKSLSKSDFFELKPIYGIINKSENKKTGCSFIFLILISITAAYMLL